MGEDCALKTQVTTIPLTCGVFKKMQLANPWKDGAGQAQNEGEKNKFAKRTPSLMPDACLQELKDARPWYQGVDCGVLQLILSRVNEAFNKFFKGRNPLSLNQVTLASLFITNWEELKLSKARFTSIKLVEGGFITRVISQNDLKLKH